MRIGITCHPTAGGSGVLATELGIALAQRGHLVHFVTSEAPFRLSDFHPNVFGHTVSMVMYPLFRQPPGGLALAAKIADVAEEFGIELWHAHYAIPNASSAIMARDMLPFEKRFKIVTTLHGTDITLVGADPSFFRVTKYAMEHSDAVTAVSNWLKQETEREFKPSQPVRTIYNFVDETRFKPERPQQCRLGDPDEKIIMHISNFRPVKRVTDVVRAFKRIVDRVPARLVMVGDGPERISAAGVAKQLGVADKIKYLGNQEHMESLIPCANVIFQPSEHESFGLVPLEAMACEVPVIATASGGICEVVEHGVTGFLCDVGDIDAMAGYAITILTNPKRAKEMGRRARQRAIDLFAKDKIVVQYEQLYEELVRTKVSLEIERQG
jgi:N-acetyl-alpha-D-glucosaminyl L-malate synthase BshA